MRSPCTHWTHLEGPAGVDGHMCLLPHIALIATEGPGVCVQGPFVPGPHQEVEGACGGDEESGAVRVWTRAPLPSTSPRLCSPATAHSTSPDWFTVPLSGGRGVLDRDREDSSGASIHQDALQIFFHSFLSFLMS